MKYISKIILILICCMGINAYAQSAQQIMKSLVEKYNNSTSIVTIFTLQNGDFSIDGNITTEGNKFKLSLPNTEIWYDGKTLWTYSSDTNEVNITEPTDDELQEINPFAILTAFTTDYSSKLITENSKSKIIELNSIQNDALVKRANIEIDKKTIMPQNINLIMNNGSTTQIHINNITFGKHLPSSFFSFDATKYPNTDIIDLR